MWVHCGVIRKNSSSYYLRYFLVTCKRAPSIILAVFFFSGGGSIVAEFSLQRASKTFLSAPFIRSVSHLHSSPRMSGIASSSQQALPLFHPLSLRRCPSSSLSIHHRVLSFSPPFSLSPENKYFFATTKRRQPTQPTLVSIYGPDARVLLVFTAVHFPFPCLICV